MPTLEWIGKEKVINHHQDVPYRVLERQYSYDEQGQHAEDNGSENMIIHGDNLEALKSLLPRYEGKIKCIYIDPPYNTGNEGWVYNDNVNDPKIRKWLGEVVGKEGEDLSRHDKWLCMMYPRLKLLYKLLDDEGVIFISIDDIEYANLKLVCDEIFGSNCFASNVSWQRTYASRNDSKGISNAVEHVLVYSKQPNWNPNRLPRTAEMNAKYGNPDNDISEWRTDNAFAPGASTHQGMVYAIQNPFKGGIAKKTYLNSVGGRAPTNFWSYSEAGHTDEAKKEMLSIFNGRATFDTPKPCRLLEFVLSVAGDENTLILDSFAGSGTTAHAVLNMNKADGGNRKFILIEMMDYADSITAERVKRVIKGYGEDKKAVPGTGGNFSYYELGEPLMIGDNLNEAVSTNKIREYIWFTETKENFQNPNADKPYYLGSTAQTGYYFFYEPNRACVLDYKFLSTITVKADNYVIYADRCAINTDDLQKFKVIFKKIPRDITKL